MCMVIYYLKSIWVCLCCLSLLFQTQIALFPYVPDYFSLLSGHCSWKFICGSFLRSTMDRVTSRGFVLVFTEPHGVLPVWGNQVHNLKLIQAMMIKVKICFRTGMEPHLLRNGFFFTLSPLFYISFWASKLCLVPGQPSVQFSGIVGNRGRLCSGWPLCS